MYVLVIVLKFWRRSVSCTKSYSCGSFRLFLVKRLYQADVTWITKKVLFLSCVTLQLYFTCWNGDGLRIDLSSFNMLRLCWTFPHMETKTKMSILTFYFFIIYCLNFIRRKFYYIRHQNVNLYSLGLKLFYSQKYIKKIIPYFSD